MYPILIDLWGLTVPSWHFCYFIGALVALLLLLHLVRVKGKVTRRLAIDIYLLCYVAGYFGARILSIIVEQTSHDLFSFMRQVFAFGSLTLYGGVILASVCAFLYTWLRNVSFLLLSDYFSLVFLPALAIGRIGCFLNGDDFGIATDSFFGVVFPNLKDGLARHPTQLYESFFCVIAFAFFYKYFEVIKRRFFVGAVGISIVGSYALFRFANEYLRDDYRGWVIENTLSTSQFISAVIFLLLLCSFLVKTSQASIHR